MFNRGLGFSTASRGLVNEETVGMRTAHEKVHGLVEDLFARAERPATDGKERR